jgi:hypothetical protein
MKVIVIKNSRSSSSMIELLGRSIRSKLYIDCTGTTAAQLINPEHPFIISLKLNESVNGDNDMMTMLSSIDANIRLRVSIFDTNLIKERFNSYFNSLRTHTLQGGHSHKLRTH